MAEVSQMLADTLRPLRADTILEIGCGDGEFTEVLVEHLAGYRHIEAIDTDNAVVEEARDYFNRAHNGAPVFFSVTDASALPWSTETFDMVVISNTVHHVREPDALFAEIFRVVTPTGKLLLHEMVADVDTTPQQVGRDLHHLKAWVDRTQGISHGPTWTRSALAEILNMHRFEDCKRREYSPVAISRADADLETRLEYIDDYTEHAAGTPDYADIRREALRLKQRARTVGFAAPPQVLALCRKAARSDTENRRNP